MADPALDVAFAIPGDLNAPSGGYAYARHLLSDLPSHGVQAHFVALPVTFPHPDNEDLDRTRFLLDQIHPSTPVLFDGLAFGALPSHLADEIASPVIALVHHPLALETGLSTNRRDELRESERAALAHAHAVIATSRFTARVLESDYGVPAERITVAEPGTERAARANGTGDPLTLLAVGTVSPRKGYTILIDALRELAASPWQLTIVGSLTRNTEEANKLREAVLASGLRDRITLAGDVPHEQLEQAYATADLFVMPSLYEGYGMVLAEAMARGLPIVCTTGGAAAETVPDDAAIKVPPGDAAHFGAAVASMVQDQNLRRKCADASWRAGQSLPTWKDTAATVADIAKRLSVEGIR